MDPIAFKIDSFAIYWYGILVAGGFMAGLWTASRRCIIDKLDGKVTVSYTHLTLPTKA